jgi:hypothetical protein
MLDVGDAGNLGGGVLQQPRDGGRFIDNSRERRECTLIVQSFLWIEHWSASYMRSTCGLMHSSRIVRPLGAAVARRTRLKSGSMLGVGRCSIEPLSCLRAYLDGHHFDGETIRQMGIALESRSAPPPTVTTQFVWRLRSASSRLRKPVSTIPSVSVSAPCGRPVLRSTRIARSSAGRPGRRNLSGAESLGPRKVRPTMTLEKSPGGTGAQDFQEGVEGATMTSNRGGVGSSRHKPEMFRAGKPRPGS